MSTLDDRTRAGGPPAATDYEQVQRSADFVELRRRYRSFAFPMTGFFLVWYFLYVLLSTFAVDFMSTRVVGNITIGLVFGLLQFVTTGLITWAYVRHANRNLDPLAEKLRIEIEEGR